MFPTLGSIGPFNFYTFGLMAAIAIVLPGIFVAIDLRQRGLDSSNAVEIMLGGAVGGFVGARLYYVVEHWGEPGEGILSGSGLAWYGGLAGGVIGVIIVAKWRGIALGTMANITAAPLALAYAIGRIGCQLAGDGDYGPATGLPWGMSFPDGTAPTLEIVHPTPIYEALAMLVAFYILWRMRGRFVRPWSLFGLYLVLAGTERVLAEIVSRNPDVVPGLSAPQIYSIIIIIIGAVVLTRGSGASGAAPPTARR